MFKHTSALVWSGIWIIHLLAGVLLTLADNRFVAIGFNPLLFSFFLLYAVQNYKFQEKLEDLFLEYEDFADNIYERLLSAFVVLGLVIFMSLDAFLPWFNFWGSLVLATTLLLGKLFLFRRKPSTFNVSWIVFIGFALLLSGLDYTQTLGEETALTIYYIKLVGPTVIGLVWTVEATHLLLKLQDSRLREIFSPPAQS